MSSNDSAIRVTDLSKRYEIYDAPRDRLKQFILPRLDRLLGGKQRQFFNEYWALKDISFEVKKGEAVGIVGRNGSGKSTLLQIITGTLSPTSGAVSTQGRIAALLELGSGFNPEFSGRENVYLNGTLLGFSREQLDEKFDAIASFADIGQYLNQPVKTYSSGMMLRLAFAVQVQVEPDILIVDEALAVGDALFQKRCFQRIEKLLSDGTTVLFVSHDQESIRTLTNRALLLNKGSAVSWGLSSEVVLDYRRLLHEEESAYFTSLAKDLVERAQISKECAVPSVVDEIAGAGESAEVLPVEAAKVVSARSERLSFGDGEVKIIQVETLDKDGSPCSMYYPGEKLSIRVTCESRANIDKLNIGIRLRNKEGVKIYSWGTLNQDMRVRYIKSNAPVFWERKFHVGDRFQVVLECVCNLGVNLYEVQASASFEETPDYLAQHMLHWIDEAAFFQVSIKQDEYFFGGVVDLRMSATW
ncbi:sugar ABC transporter ATP-binding protein [Pseudomonas protegens]|uniref:ABC transporter ATP-binding protein n=1 Tax=Pseudomonas protegens TaxID=380021 RepID=UPI000F4AFAA9|nr:ABC transporter ATP-binding protein [Pseudomonas protegens]ROL80493.1 sugar ABC transporter ATP-binding protein [Pseudomonas protegens]